MMLLFGIPVQLSAHHHNVFSHQYLLIHSGLKFCQKKVLKMQWNK